MKRIWMYLLLFIISYLVGYLCFNGAITAMNISERSEYHLLHTGITMFFIFMVVPAYSLATYVLRSVMRSTLFWLQAVVLIIIGFFVSLLVPFYSGFGFGYLNASYFSSEMAILLYVFFIASAIIFTLGTVIIERTFQRD
ncbi:hypothetical protein [Paenibacillus pini]|uniref:Uncharacterized protein n=1 Tax=Paenibacillus pini JCM 16418 TaxID=1236976 RepID=W7YD05_9BACL|nr:hypothetical protein [Paenibacillus pini]GAF08785.1 hypothetical protein JCM16418_2890 [Paenibacillus pini JCM 16418]